MEPRKSESERTGPDEPTRPRRTGLVTLLFTDIVGSTELKQRLGDRAGAEFFDSHHQIVRATLAGIARGREIETAGDSFLITFSTPSDAVQFALLLQARLRHLARKHGLNDLDRVGIHVGEVVIKEEDHAQRPKDLYGIQIDACSRVMSLANAGQILMTRAVFDSARQVLKGEDIEGVAGVEWLNHGPYALKGLDQAVEICEVRETGQAAGGPPASSDKAQRRVAAGDEQVLGWRPAVGLLIPNTKWMLQEKLGEGGFGEVWLGRHQTMKELRVFKFCFQAERVRFLKRELTLFRLLKERIGDHPNIVRLHEVFLDAPPCYVEMDYVAGKDLRTWVGDHGGIASIPLETRLEIVAQAAEALQAAHDSGIIHRDVKPTNILVGGKGANPRDVRVKLTDFGIGQVVSQEYLAGITRAGFTQTLVPSSSSSQSGTHLYMAPELLAGRPASTGSDIYSLGVVLFQLLIEDFSEPVTTDWIEKVPDSLLRDDLKRCFAGNPNDRFSHAEQLAQNLRTRSERQRILMEQQARAAIRQKTDKRWRLIGTAAVAALIIGLGSSLIWFLNRNANVRWAREQALPELTRLAQEEDYSAALALALRTEKYIPNDPALTNLWPQISVLAAIETTPPGADVSIKEYRKPEAAWQHLGKAPVKGIRLPRGFYRWKIALDGYVESEQAFFALPDPDFPRFGGTNRFALDATPNVPPGIVRVPGGETSLAGLAGLDHVESVRLDDYFMDKHEVSNRQFKEFVDRGGYATTNYWKHPFNKQGKALTWAEAMAEFRDASGQPGPATWKNGTFPDTEADHPVTGVSWHEAAAYAEFAGKRLPSIYHWNRSAGTRVSAFIVPLSNFAGRKTARVGSHQGMSPSGAYDMAGNAKEWCWNEAAQGKRYILGGAFGEPDYMFMDPDAQAPFARLPTFGFRCVRLLSDLPLAEGIDDPVSAAFRDYTQEQPVSEEIFRAYKSLFSYDKTTLDARIESADDSPALWRKERISFNAAYGDERVTAYLFLPKNFAPPYQTVVIFPGAGAISQRSSENFIGSAFERLHFVISSGRAVIFPIYKGTYERGGGLKTDSPMPTIFYRDHVIMWSKDLGRSIDYLETRNDILRDKIAFCGISWGGAMGALLPAVESRLKANLLLVGGLYFQKTFPEVDQINFAPRVTIPTLMLNGRHDFFFPVETSQRPLFRLLGTSTDHKRHVIFDTGHSVPQHQLSKEILEWLDKYLGPVK